MQQAPSPAPDSDGSLILDPLVHSLYEELTQTWQYVVADPRTRQAVIIDPHLDNGPSDTMISTIAADRILAVVEQNRYTVDSILHTHEGRRHPSSAWYLRAQILRTTNLAPRVVTTTRTMTAVQRVFRRKYNMDDGSAWNTDFGGTFADGQVFSIGSLKGRVLHLTGGSFALVVGQRIFTATADLSREVQGRHSSLLSNLKDYRIYTPYDSPPTRKARLMPVCDNPVRKDQGRKLVIRYAAE